MSQSRMKLFSECAYDFVDGPKSLFPILSARRRSETAFRPEAGIAERSANPRTMEE
jgi:hypothetical protein